MQNSHRNLDNFIQNSLNKFEFVEPSPELYKSTGNDKDLIISHKSAIPDLVIWNKTFNKNKCFEEFKAKTENPFPRHRFYLKLNSSIYNNKTQIKNNITNSFSPNQKNLNLKKEILTQKDNNNPIQNITELSDTSDTSNQENILFNNNKEIKKNVNDNNNNRKKLLCPSSSKNKQNMTEYFSEQFQKNEKLIVSVNLFSQSKGWVLKYGSANCFIDEFSSFELFQFLTERLKHDIDLTNFKVEIKQNNTISFNGEQFYFILSQALPVIINYKKLEMEFKNKNKNNNLTNSYN